MFESRFMIHKPYCHARCAGQALYHTGRWKLTEFYTVYSLVFPLCIWKKKKILLLLRYIFIFAFFSLSSSSKPIVSIVQSFEYFRTLYERLQWVVKNNINKSLRIALRFTFDLKCDVVRVFVIRPSPCCLNAYALSFAFVMFICVCVDMHLSL